MENEYDAKKLFNDFYIIRKTLKYPTDNKTE